MRKTIKDNMVFIVASIAVLIFVLICNRLMLKTDDGNFLGIALNPSFTYKGFLTSRYNTVSGRTVNEFLVMFFLRHNIILYKLCNSALICYIIWFWMRLCSLFKNRSVRTDLFCASGLFLMIVSCLNPSVFWFSGSFSYLWSFAGVLMLIYPLIYYIFKQKINFGALTISAISSLLATSQEQGIISAIIAYVSLLIIIFVSCKNKNAEKKSNIPLWQTTLLAMPLAPVLLLSYHLFSAPGVQGRMTLGAVVGFERYLDFSAFKKCILGLGSFYANVFFMSFFLMIVFSLLLSKKAGKFKMGLVITLIDCLAANVASLLVSKTLPHIVMRRFFTSVNPSDSVSASAIILFIFGLIQTFLILYMVIRIIKEDRETGIGVLICLAIGFACAMAMGFSSTIFLSGQRVYFYTNASIITASVILLSSIKEDKQIRAITNLAYIYAALMLIINIFAFAIVEHPLMG